MHLMLIHSPIRQPTIKIVAHQHKRAQWQHHRCECLSLCLCVTQTFGCPAQLWLGIKFLDAQPNPGWAMTILSLQLLLPHTVPTRPPSPTSRRALSRHTGLPPHSAYSASLPHLSQGLESPHWPPPHPHWLVSVFLSSPPKASSLRWFQYKITMCLKLLNLS